MKIAIAGFGMEGVQNLAYWNQPGNQLTIVDVKNPPDRPVPVGVATILGPKAFLEMTDFDLVVRTASLRPDAIKTNGRIWSATNEFFTRCPAPIIGVTGTKGKGTTSTLIAGMLENAGKKVHLLGNIGVPALSVLDSINKDDIVVFELSSFQLWDLTKSPQVAVVLMIEADHLDVHKNMAEYLAAKSSIAAYQSPADYLIYHPTNQFSAQVAKHSKAQKIRYQMAEGARVIDQNIVINGQIICKTSEVGLIGQHNLDNICAAVSAAWLYTQDVGSIKKAIQEFKGLPHRLEFVRDFNDVKYYDDSQATGPASTRAALDSFAANVVLVLGGSDKGLDISSLLARLNPNRHRLILIGQTADKIELNLQKNGFSQYVKLGITTMPEIVAEAQKIAEELAKPAVVLLSPAHASFGMFENYGQRGDQFKAAVLGLQ